MQLNVTAQFNLMHAHAYNASSLQLCKHKTYYAFDVIVPRVRCERNPEASSSKKFPVPKGFKFQSSSE